MINLRGLSLCSVMCGALGLLLVGCGGSAGSQGGGASSGSQARSGGAGGTASTPQTGSGGGPGGNGGFGGGEASGGGASGGASEAGGRTGGNSGAGGGASGRAGGSSGSIGSAGTTRTGSGGGLGGNTGGGGSGSGGSLDRDGGAGGFVEDAGDRLDGRAGSNGDGPRGGTVDAGGAGAGGTTSTGPCTVTDWGTPPSGDSKWIDESWSSQLSNNVKTRKEWLLDSAIAGKGQINICVRWGATSAPSADLKTNIGGWVEKWFNDWFKNLDGYACFPYPRITAKVTGWAVRKGNESWVSDLDATTTKVYTDVETGSDPANEPKCADACSFFTADGKGNHSFPNCPGGDAFHFDYSMWLDDKLPGSGAAAVGGDWGLRMPAADFIALKGAPSTVVEHEMGHGFGFQDYYDWTQDKPADGSLMIVGSTSSKTPTLGDVWLLRRTWQEVKALRGW